MNHGKVERPCMVKGNLCVKIHLAVDAETKQALAMLVTPNGTRLKSLPHNCYGRLNVTGVCKVYADGTYDSPEVDELLEHRGIAAVIKPRRNSRPDTPSEPGRKVVALHERLWDKRWPKLKG